jgi:DNA polymerase delta subunit 1
MSKVRKFVEAECPQWQLFESTIDPIIQFCDQIGFTSWIRLKSSAYSAMQPFSHSSCQVVVRVRLEDIDTFACDENARFLQMSYDIETNSSTQDFPSPDNDDDVIYQIASTFKWFGSPPDDVYLKTLFTIGPCNPILDTVVVSCRSESELLVKWARMVHGIDPDIVYSYNGYGFDDNYVHTRALKFASLYEHIMCDLSRLSSSNASLVTNKFESKARGNSSFQRLNMPGRFNFDLLVYIRSEFKLEFYKLDFVAQEFLGQHKNPVTPAMIFAAYAKQDAKATAEIGRYCIQDTLLPQRICDKKEILTSIIEMSRITFVKVQDLLLKGQQIKVLSQILKFAHAQGFLVPTINETHAASKMINSVLGGGGDEKNFKGASVLDPIVGKFWWYYGL